MFKWVVGLCAAMYGVLMIYGEPTPEELAARELRDNQQVTRSVVAAPEAPAVTETAALEPDVEPTETAPQPAIVGASTVIESPALVSATTDTTTPAAPQPVTTIAIAPETQVETETAETEQASVATTNEIWRVTASAVNLRSGPSTNNAVIGRATQNDSAEIIEMLPSGWAKVYILETGTEAFMSAQFLAAPE